MRTFEQCLRLARETWPGRRIAIRVADGQVMNDEDHTPATANIHVHAHRASDEVGHTESAPTVEEAIEYLAVWITDKARQPVVQEDAEYEVEESVDYDMSDTEF